MWVTCGTRDLVTYFMCDLDLLYVWPWPCDICHWYIPWEIFGKMWHSDLVMCDLDQLYVWPWPCDICPQYTMEHMYLWRYINGYVLGTYDLDLGSMSLAHNWHDLGTYVLHVTTYDLIGKVWHDLEDKWRLIQIKIEICLLSPIIFLPFNPLAPRRTISAAKKSLYNSRLRDIVSRSIPETYVDKCWYYNRVSRCPTISSVECMWILHSWCTKFGQIFHLNLGARLAIHGTNGQWHIIVRTWCIHDIQV
jgi:hypothetical protein